MVKKTIVVFLYLIPIVFIFKNWFISPFLSAHDFPYLFREALYDFSLFPSVWNPVGLGSETINYGLGIFIHFIVFIFVNTFSLSWELIYKVFIFGLFLFLSVISSSYLLIKILKRPNIFQLFLSVLIFTANTYILMVVDGGQMGVALAYSIAPLVLGRLITIVQSSSRQRRDKVQSLIMAGLVLAVQVMFDTRIAFVTMGIFFLYTAYHYLFIKRFGLKLYAVAISIVGFIIFGFHAAWVLPIIIFRSHPAQEVFSSFSSVESLRFFSFATFPQTLSFLHPNWPENIFGKVYFMKPEFILLPILAFSGLLLLRFRARKDAEQNAEQRRILFFALLGLMGAFLAKGANEPFSFLNQWIFQHIPGMSMFRDPTKFYLLVALSYSILLPFSVHSVSVWINSKLKVQNAKSQLKIQNYLPTVFLIFTILYFLFLIRPIFLNQLSGTFAKHDIPPEYVKLKNFLYSQKNFSRTLWVPTQQRYNFYSYTHPAIPADGLFSATNSAEIAAKLQEENIRELISNLSIRYVIVPYDSFGEIFVEDRNYNEDEYFETINVLDGVNWLKRIKGFGKIAIYEVPDYKDHFWLDDGDSLSYKEINPSNYRLEVSIGKASNLIFTDAYSPYWVVFVDGKEIGSEKTAYNTNSFPLGKTGRYNLTIAFSKEKYYAYGKIITLIFIALLLFVLIYIRKKAKV